MRACSKGFSHASSRRAYLLMEVVISVGLLILGLTFVGAQIQKTLESSYGSENLTRLMMMAESKVAELDAGIIRFDQEADDEVEGDFTLRIPDYGWRMRFSETATVGMWAITLEILNEPRESKDAEFDFEAAAVVYAVYLMRPDPAVLDVRTDLGLDEEKILELQESLPPEFFDGDSLNPAMFASLDFEQLVELLPSIISLFGENAQSLINSLPPEFRAMLDLEELGLTPDGQIQQPDAPQPQGQGDDSAQPGQRNSPAGGPLDELSDEDLNMFGTTRDQLGGGGRGTGGGGGTQQRPGRNQGQSNQSNRGGGRRGGR